ncbi:hypothetical protein PLICRDRAFT_176826 [Plicaturopsis crispa FD-325 SS-3]|nr:hypothetical protein PLICRDRAFT_176826 [Plicaturopsis crispa FD-325 SS-3]
MGVVHVVGVVGVASEIKQEQEEKALALQVGDAKYENENAKETAEAQRLANEARLGFCLGDISQMEPLWGVFNNRPENAAHVNDIHHAYPSRSLWHGDPKVGRCTPDVRRGVPSEISTRSFFWQAMFGVQRTPAPYGPFTVRLGFLLPSRTFRRVPIDYVRLARPPACKTAQS